MSEVGDHRVGGMALAAAGALAQLGWPVGLGVLAALAGIVLGLTGRLELARHPGDRTAVAFRRLADVVLGVGLVGLFVAGLTAVG